MISNPLSPLTLLSLIAFAAGATAQDAKPMDLRTTAKKGAVLHYQQVSDQAQVIDLGGQEMEMGNKVTTGVKLTVVDVSEQGELGLRIDLVRVSGTMSIPMMGDIEFDSAGPETEDDGMGLSGVANAIASVGGKSFTAKVSAYGKIVSIDGIDKLIENAAEAAGEMGGQMLSSVLNEGNLRGLVSEAFGSLPEKPVAVGEAWNKDDKQSRRGTPMQQKLELKLAGCKDDSFEVAISGTVEKGAGKIEGMDELEGEEADMAKQVADGMQIKNGKISGKETISRVDGFVIESSKKVSMEIEAPNPMGDGDMRITVTQTNTTKRCAAEDLLPKKPAPKAEAKEAGKTEAAPAETKK